MRVYWCFQPTGLFLGSNSCFLYLQIYGGKWKIFKQIHLEITLT